MRRLLGFVIGLFVRLWLLTLRVCVEVDPAFDLDLPAPAVLAFWHGQQHLLLAWKRRRRTLVMVSWSRDGELQSGAMRALGLRVVRGSSSRGGMRGLRELVRRLDGSHDAAFAVDGPRGPLHEVKPGARAAARLAGARLVPLAAAASRARVLRRTWDRFEVPLPFSRVAVVLGAPLDAAVCDERALALAIDAARERAESMLPRYRALVETT